MLKDRYEKYLDAEFNKIKQICMENYVGIEDGVEIYYEEEDDDCINPIYRSKVDNKLIIMEKIKGSIKTIDEEKSSFLNLDLGWGYTEPTLTISIINSLGKTFVFDEVASENFNDVVKVIEDVNTYETYIEYEEYPLDGRYCVYRKINMEIYSIM